MICLYITPTTPPRFPCWLWQSKCRQWQRMGAEASPFASMAPSWGFTHWHPDQEKAPIDCPVSRRVVCAAMRMDDGLIVTGVRHFSPDMRAVLRRLYPQRSRLDVFLRGGERPAYHQRVVEQGFVDQYGTFLSREQAWVVAEREGQIREQVSTVGTLYSENCW